MHSSTILNEKTSYLFVSLFWCEEWKKNTIIKIWMRNTSMHMQYAGDGAGLAASYSFE